MRVLHAIHDFLPRHRAGSEVYAHTLCKRLAREHDVYVLCAEFDPTRPHGSLTWRFHEDLPVIELVNNWAFDSFAESYASPALNQTLDHVLRAVQPDVLHLHSLLNLSFDLPRLARDRGIPVVATLHDYTLVCPSGGQRVHVAEEHVCEVIDPGRCARCFPQSPLYGQMAFARLSRRTGRSGPLLSLARRLRWLPGLTSGAQAVARGMGVVPVDAEAIVQRLRRVEAVFAAVDVFVSPSRALAAEFERLGLPAGKLRVADYGFAPLARRTARRRDGPLRIGFVGTLVWHKGAHILLQAVRPLPGDRFEVRFHGDETWFPEYAASLRRLARGLPVRFMGPFDAAQVAATYAELDVLVVPSLWPENSPLVVHEAFMAGVPVVAARMGGLADLVREGVNGLLYQPRGVGELTAVLRRLIEEPALLDRLSVTTPVRTLDDDAAEWQGIYHSLAVRA